MDWSAHNHQQNIELLLSVADGNFVARISRLRISEFHIRGYRQIIRYGRFPIENSEATIGSRETIQFPRQIRQ